MKSHTESFASTRRGSASLVHLTPRLEDVLERSGIVEGFFLVGALHVTAGFFAQVLGGELYAPLSRVDWAILLRRTFGLDVLACPRCDGRMRLLAMVTEPKSVTRYLRGLGEPTDAPARAPARGPPFWKSRVLRRAASDHAAE